MSELEQLAALFVLAALGWAQGVSGAVPPM